MGVVGVRAASVATPSVGRFCVTLVLRLEGLLVLAASGQAVGTAGNPSDVGR